jgi:hypothetical protein
LLKDGEEESGESGKGVDAGIRVSFETVATGGVGFGEVDEAVETSTDDRLARSRSSKFIFNRGLSGMEPDSDVLFSMGGPTRLVVGDLHKLDSADSASWVDDSCEVEPGDVSTD